MISFFSISQSDQSVYFLSQIFGFVPGVLSGGDSAPLLLGLMFKFFNTLALIVGSIIVVYTTVMGLLHTAHEGEFMGKKWTGPWVPIRTVLGIALLFPTGSGYSAIQVVFMWIILQGVGAADTLWTNVLGFVNVAGSPYAGFTVPTVEVDSTMKTLFQSLTCQATAYYPAWASPPNNPYGYFCGQFGCGGAKPNLTLTPTAGATGNNTYVMGGNGASCGTLNYCNPTACPGDTSSLSYQICVAACAGQISALTQIIPVMGGYAWNFADVDFQYTNFYFTPFPAGKSAPPPVAQALCSVNNVSAGQCCNKQQNPNAGVLGELSTIPCASAGIFPDPTASNVPGNVSTDVVQKVLYPALLPTMGTNFYNAMVSEYVSQIQNNVDAVIINAAAQPSAAPANAQYGWIMAGAYYYQIAKINNNNVQSGIPPFSVEASDPNATAPGWGYRTNFTAAGDLSNQIIKNAPSSAGGLSFSLPPEYANISSAVSGAQSSLVNSFMDNLTQNSCEGLNCSNAWDKRSINPLISISTFGYQMMILAQVLFAVVVTVIAILAAVLDISPIFLGTGLTLAPEGEAFKTVVLLLAPFFLLLVVALYSLGALLGIYVPLIPFMIFTMGAIGWFIATIEAMVAAPFVALGILNPYGQHEIMGQSQHALGLMFNLFLRPALMVFGMMASMLLSVVVVMFINSGFIFVMNTIMGYPGLFEQILFIAAYTMLIIAALNKTFSLIHHVPERVLSWIGVQAQGYGEEQALGEVKGSVTGAAGQVSGGAKGTGGAAAGALGAKFDREKAELNKPSKKPEISGGKKENE